MPTVQIEKKYTYSQESGRISIPYPIFANASYVDSNFNASIENGMIPYVIQPYSTGGYSYPFMLTPMPVLPSKGPLPNDRVNSSIKVTSIQWKCTLTMPVSTYMNGQTLPPSFTSSYSIVDIAKKYPSATDQTGSSTFASRPIQIPPNPNMYYKMRYMVVEFDEDIAINPNKLLSWYYSTFCQYRDPTQTPTLPVPNAAATIDAVVPPPVSAHSKLLRITTPWTGKFNILADRCVTLSAQNPRASIDTKVIINRTYKFDDDVWYTDMGVNYLLKPHIYCFVIPPLSFEKDLGFYDTYQIDSINLNIGTPVTTVNYQAIFSYDSWVKLNFIDL